MADGAPEPPSPSLPEEEHFEIALTLDRDDLRPFDREYATPRMGCGVAIAVLGGYFAVGVAAFVLGPRVDRHYGFDEPMLVTLAIATLGLLAFSYAARYLTGPMRVAVDTNRSFLVTMIDGLWLQLPSDVRVCPWTAFKDMIVSDQAIYLGIEDRKAIMLPRRVFQDWNDFYTFVSVMAKYAHI